MSNSIYRTLSAEINFSVKDSEGEPVDISAATDIRACIQSLVLDIGGGGCVIVNGVLGQWKVVFTIANTTGLTTGKDTIVGQIEFGTATNPIEFRASVEIKDKPC